MDQRDPLILRSRYLGTDRSLAGPGETPFPQQRFPRATPVPQAVPDPLQTCLPPGNHPVLPSEDRDKGPRRGPCAGPSALASHRALHRAE